MTKPSKVMIFDYKTGDWEINEFKLPLNRKYKNPVIFLLKGNKLDMKKEIKRLKANL